jgi:pSer/pThr/pTyr-binding forkhead associated (FHA) protein
VSGKHCSITLTDDHILIEDLSSTNGTYVNDEKVGQRKIFISDHFRVGQNRFEIDQDMLNTSLFERYRFKGLLKTLTNISVEGNRTLFHRLNAFSKNGRKVRRKKLTVEETSNEYNASSRAQIALVTILVQLVFIGTRKEETLMSFSQEKWIVIGIVFLIEFLILRHFIGRSTKKKSL